VPSLPPHLEALLGRRVSAPIVRSSSVGAYVAPPGVDPRDALLVPARELPVDASVGVALDVFVYLDSDDRPIATTTMPRLLLGEVTFLEVTAVTNIGAFVAWGPIKELLVPFAEQSFDLEVGQRHPIGLYLDRSGRLAGTTNVRPLLAAPPTAAVGDWVEGEAWRNEPGIGLFVIVERRAVGLVPASEPHRVRRGERVRCRVAAVLPDGKRVLSLRDLAHRAAEGDAERILAAVRTGPAVSDLAGPDEVRSRFGLSRKAFKRAVGHLLRTGVIQIAPDGRITATPPPPP
jgi:predicted RNA-binding protein (virulence factor B family)